MTGIPIPPPHEPISNQEGRLNDVWYRFFEGNFSALTTAEGSIATRLPSTLPVPVAEGGTASTSASAARSALGVVATSTGTWTPDILIGGTTVGHTYVNQAGHYVKTGSVVSLWGAVQISAYTPSTVGEVQIKGIPFAGANEAGARYAGSVGFYSGILGTQLCRLTTASTVLELYTAGTTGAVLTPSSSAIGGQVAVHFFLQYITTQ